MFRRMRKVIANGGGIEELVDASLISKKSKSERLRRIEQMELSEKALEESYLNRN
jgi:hypothetical protein